MRGRRFAGCRDAELWAGGLRMRVWLRAEELQVGGLRGGRMRGGAWLRVAKMQTRGLRGGELRGGAWLRGNDVATLARSPSPRAARPGNGARRLPRPQTRLPPLQPAPSPPPSAAPAAAESRGPVAAACGTLAATSPSRGREKQLSRAGRGLPAAGTGGHGPAGRLAVARAIACPVSSLRRPRPARGDRCPGWGLPGRWRPRA